MFEFSEAVDTVWEDNACPHNACHKTRFKSASASTPDSTFAVADGLPDLC